MSIINRLDTVLKKNKVKFETIPHTETFTSQETAQIEHIPGKEMAKVVMVKADGKDVMVVIPASYKLDMGKLKAFLNAKEIRLDTEKEFENLFPDCEKGAMPPFGDLYHLPWCVDSSIAKNEKIVFNAGTHCECIRMAYKDYEKLAKPRLADLVWR